jgi:hypothetical protein
MLFMLNVATFTALILELKRYSVATHYRYERLLTPMNQRSINVSLHLIATLQPEAHGCGTLDAIPNDVKVSSASRAALLAMAMKGFQSELGEGINVTALSGDAPGWRQK